MSDAAEKNYFFYAVMPSSAERKTFSLIFVSTKQKLKLSQGCEGFSPRVQMPRICTCLRHVHAAGGIEHFCRNQLLRRLRWFLHEILRYSADSNHSIT